MIHMQKNGEKFMVDQFLRVFGPSLTGKSEEADIRNMKQGERHKKMEWREGLCTTFSFWPLYSTHIFPTLTHTRMSGGNVGIGKWSMKMKQLEKHYISLWNK